MPNLNDPRIPVLLFGLTTGIALSAVVQYLYQTYQTQKTITEAQSEVPQDELDSIAPSTAAEATIDRIRKEFYIPAARLQNMLKAFVKDMQRGLKQDGAIMKMIPSYVTRRASGSETGTYLALDLGGTNFRVCQVTLEGAGKVRTKQRKFVVSQELQKGTGTALFDFLAECVEKFLEESGIGKDTRMHLGFTFSFPVMQQAVNKGVLMSWTKGFTASNVVNEDVVSLLQAAFKRKNMNIKVAALVNDTVGTLASHAYVDPATVAGIILGTGTNAAYVEKIDQIPKWKGARPASGEMIVNMEWGNWGADRIPLPSTHYDNKLDRHSPNTGQQLYEKMISGMYLGEITRYVLLDLIATGELLRGQEVPELKKQYSFDTANMSRIERDYTKDLSDTRLLLEELYGITTSTLADREIVKHVCQFVGTRAARLAAVGIAGIVTKINKLDGCTIAIDGSVYEHYQHFGNRVRDALRELLGMCSDSIVLAQARDGSGQGAALIAALAES
ncbi:hexokinase A [Borealophlyctis nickersoniae]|nr:hexokinase A [Borealophlyctis nickersoniae]